MRTPPVAAVLAALLLQLPATAQAPPPAGATEITLLHFSDYHSHALPFWSDGRARQAGIARALAFFKQARRDPRTLIVSGGDMLNRGVPAWSDEFRCVEWPWFRGLLDAMALGNHDLDYGAEAFDACRNDAPFPILSANLLRADGAPYLVAGGKPYVVKEVDGLRIGLFALGGPDLQRLVKPQDLPRGATWADAQATARTVVSTLRQREQVHAVVFIGHQSREEDEALARAVPGIDLILGTHSHSKSELRTIPGTQTRYVSPFQYLAYVSRVTLRFRDGRLADVGGGLVKMDESLPEDFDLSARVNQLQRDLQARRPERFERVGLALGELSDAGLSTGESAVGNWATDALRRAAGAHVFFGIVSGIRGGLPPGPLTLEDFLGAFPYANKLAAADMTGRQVLDWLALSVERAGSDRFCPQSGLRYVVRGGRPADVQVAADPAGANPAFAPLDPQRTYRVATTDYQAAFVDGYKELFAAAGGKVTTIDAREALLAALRSGPIKGSLDGRSRSLE